MTLANRTLDAARRARAAASRAASATYDAIAPEVIARYEKTMAANAEYVVRDPARAKRLGREFVGVPPPFTPPSSPLLPRAGCGLVTARRRGSARPGCGPVVRVDPAGSTRTKAGYQAAHPRVSSK